MRPPVASLPSEPPSSTITATTIVGFWAGANPTIVVAVIVLDGGSLGSEATGGRIAAPIARAVMQAALDQTGP